MLPANLVYVGAYFIIGAALLFWYGGTHPKSMGDEKEFEIARHELHLN